MIYGSLREAGHLLNVDLYSKQIDFFIDMGKISYIITYQPVCIIPTGRNDGMKTRGIRFDTAHPKHSKKIMKIAKIAAELFGTKGYLETSMDNIAAVAKVTKGGVYHYFRSKTEVLYFICSKYVDLDLENLEESLAGIEDPIEKIKFIIFRHIKHYATYEYGAKTLLNEAYCLPSKYYKQVKERERQYFEIVTRVLSEYLGSRAEKDIVKALAFTLFGMMNWIYSWYDPRKSLKPEGLSNLIFEIFTKGANGAVPSERQS
jgi:AcrR family transcriptional regulator